MSHESINSATGLMFDMIEHLDRHGRRLGNDNVDKIAGHITKANTALSLATKEHNKSPGSPSAIMALGHVKDHLTEAAKAFDVRDAMGQRVDLELPTQILQAQMGEPQHEFVSKYTNESNEGRKNGS